MRRAGMPCVDIVRARLRGFELGLELGRVSSVLTHQEAQGTELIDPSPWLGARSVHDGHVALVIQDVGPPVGIRIGEVRGFERWTQRELYPIPAWVAGHLPGVLFHGCGWDEAHGAIWMLDVDALIQAWVQDRRRDNEAMRRVRPRPPSELE